MSAESVAIPTGWAGGEHVAVPGLGVGRVVLNDPRVIEIELPAPECVVLLVDGTHAVVLTDPRVPYEKALRAIAMARHLEESAVDDTLAAAVGDDTPPRGLAVTATHPALRVVRSAPGG